MLYITQYVTQSYIMSAQCPHPPLVRLEDPSAGRSCSGFSGRQHLIKHTDTEAMLMSARICPYSRLRVTVHEREPANPKPLAKHDGTPFKLCIRPIWISAPPLASRPARARLALGILMSVCVHPLDLAVLCCAAADDMRPSRTRGFTYHSSFHTWAEQSSFPSERTPLFAVPQGDSRLPSRPLLACCEAASASHVGNACVLQIWP
ncbi:hypothetical protein VTO73DRAFT_6311 [Trametes versicolor]